MFTDSHKLCVVLQASVPGVPDGAADADADGTGFGTLPASGPLPPHLLVKQEMGNFNTLQQYSKDWIFFFVVVFIQVLYP